MHAVVVCTSDDTFEKRVKDLLTEDSAFIKIITATSIEDIDTKLGGGDGYGSEDIKLVFFGSDIEKEQRMIFKTKHPKSKFKTIAVVNQKEGTDMNDESADLIFGENPFYLWDRKRIFNGQLTFLHWQPI